MFDVFGNTFHTDDREPDSSTLADDVVDADFSAHRFGELFNDGKAKAGTTVLSRDGRVGLRKFMEKRRYNLGGMPAPESRTANRVRI